MGDTFGCDFNRFERHPLLVQMKVKGILYDPRNNAYIVILRDELDRGVLPLWVGKAEANAISLALEGVFTPRPLTHDLTKSVLDALEAKMISVVVTDLKENTYYAKIHLAYQDSEFTLDARPSDSVALALRTDAPIFVEEEVIKKQSSEEIDRWLESLRPEDFGKSDA